MTRSAYDRWLEETACPKRQRGRGPITNREWILRFIWSNPAAIADLAVVFRAGQSAAINSARRRRSAGPASHIKTALDALYGIFENLDAKAARNARLTMTNADLEALGRAIRALESTKTTAPGSNEPGRLTSKGA